MYPSVTTIDFYPLLPSGLFYFLNTHLTPIGFLSACNTFVFDSINQDLRFNKLFTSAIFDLFHNPHSIQVNQRKITFPYPISVVLIQKIWVNAFYCDQFFHHLFSFLVMHNMDKINLIFLILYFSLILDVVKVINVNSYEVRVSCHNFLW